MNKRNYYNALTRLEEKNLYNLKKTFLGEIKELEEKINNPLLTESEKYLLEVSFWDKAKFFMSKLGRYKAGGKILGKDKVDQEAREKLQQILSKEGNELIKKIHDEIQKMDSKGKGTFPNNQDPEIFLNIVEYIATIYDSIIAATQKKQGDEGFLPVDMANSIITDLREYVKKYLDVDLKGVYTVMDSEEESDDELITDSEEVIDTIEEDRSSDVRDRLKSKKGEDGEDVENIRMGKQGLSSNTLPSLLIGIGSAMGAFSWLANTEWFKSLFEYKFSYTDTEQVREIIETKSEVLEGIKPGEGLYKALSRITGIDVDAASDPQDFIKQLSEIGNGDPHKGIDLLCEKGGWMMKPEEAAKGLHNLVDNPDSVDNMGQFFKGAASGTGKLSEPGSGLDTTLYGTKGGTFLKTLLIKQLPVIITKTVIKTGVKTGAGYVAAKGLGAILGPIGIGLVATGALVKLMRMKGKKQSRAATLNDLLQSLQYAKETKQNPELEVIDVQKDEGGENPSNDGGDTGNKNLCNKNLDELNSTLKNIKKRSSTLKGMKLMNYSDNKMFQKNLLENFLSSKVTSIKINGNPISTTLKQLYDNGLLEAPRSRDINSKQSLPSGWENQMSAFFTDLFKLFSLLNKSCKNNNTHTQIKKFFKLLYTISREGKGNYSDDQKRAQLFKKLVGTLHNFFSSFSKVGEFTKGSGGKPSEEEINKRREAKKQSRERMDKSGETKSNVKPTIDEPQNTEKGGEEENNTKTTEPQDDETTTMPPSIPPNFLEGNRNMQLVYLSQNFLPGGKSLWNNLGLKEGTVLPSGFFDAALGQGKVDQEKYLKEFYKHLEKNDSFTKKINTGAWLTKVQSNKNQALISWVRNTRKSIGSFFTKLKKQFPEFEIGDRKQAKVSKPGERGKGMGIAGESLNGRYDLITEVDLGKTINQAGFDEKEFLKNLPQFMEMLSMMYYGAKGSKLPYNKEAVLSYCSKYGCKDSSNKKFKKSKSDDYEFMMSEQIKRIKQLMK